MKIDLIFLAFGLLAPAAFRLWRPAIAVLLVFLGGWIFLPVGHFPPGSAQAVFPYWITGLAVPSDMLLTKAWIAPAAAALGALVFDRRRLRDFRAAWVDLPMALWCLWPMLESPFTQASDPSALAATLYLCGAWGLPWLLGRVYFATPEDRHALLRGLAFSTLACLPFSLLEGTLGPTVYSTVYELHPFRADGAERYVGYRPLGFFEDGNQFGLWVSLGALTAIWLAVTAGRGRAARPARIVALVVTAMALQAQSIGALVLLGLGCVFLAACRWLPPKRMVACTAAAAVLLGAVYLSGVVPVTHLAKDTALGRQVVEGLRSAGRGSFGWRISQDQKLLGEATARPLTGAATWDWWRSRQTRPWGMTVLVLGQFGLPALCLCFGTLAYPALRVAMRTPRESGWSARSLPLLLATLVALAMLDALMNSFIFFPAVMIAGSIAHPGPATRRRGEITRIARRQPA